MCEYIICSIFAIGITIQPNKKINLAIISQIFLLLILIHIMELY